MAEVDFPFLEPFVQVAELASVVACDALEHFRERCPVLATQGFKPRRYPLFCLSGDFEDMAAARHPLVQCEKHFPGFTLPHDHVDFPMPELLPVIDCLRTLLDAFTENPPVFPAMVLLGGAPYAKRKVDAFDGDKAEVDVIVDRLCAQRDRECLV